MCLQDVGLLKSSLGTDIKIIVVRHPDEERTELLAKAMRNCSFCNVS